MFEYVIPVAIAAVGVQQAPDHSAPAISIRLSRTTHDEDMIRPALPIGSQEWTVSAADYPVEFLQDRMNAYLYVDVSVGPDGRVTDCVVTDARAARSGQPFTPAPEAFARNACSAIREHGRFRHAIDSDGNASAGVVPLIVAFRENSVPPPPAPPAPPAPGQVVIAAKPRDSAVLRLSPDPVKFTISDPSVWLDIDAKGRVTRCRVARSTGTDAGDAAMCRQMMEARFEAGRDFNGKVQPVKDYHVRLRVGDA